MDLISRFRISALVKTPRKPLLSSPGVLQPAVEEPSLWTVDRTRRAIFRHEEGDFREASLLLDAFGRDDRIRGCMRELTDSVLAKNGDFSIEGVEKDESGKSEKLAQQVESWWFDFLPDSTLSTIVYRMEGMGFCVCRVHWEMTKKEWRPCRLEPWHAYNVNWDESTRMYIAYGYSGEQLQIARDDPNWLLLVPGGDRSWMVGLVRALGEAFAIRRFNWRDWARYNERHGLPIIKILEPPAQEAKAKTLFYEAIRKMGSTGIIRLPQLGNGEGWQAEFLEAADQAYKTFPEFRKDLDISIAVAILGNDLNTEGTGGGSYALGQSQRSVRLERRSSITEVLSTGLRAGIIQRWGFYNFADWDPELAPWPNWITEQPVDRKAEAETLNIAADAVTKLEGTRAGVFVDMGPIFERLDLPMRVGGREALEADQERRAKAMEKAEVLAPGAVPEPKEDDEGSGKSGGDGGKKPAAKPAASGEKKLAANGSVDSRQMDFGVLLASGDRVAVDSGFVEGQLYVDDVVDSAAHAMGHSMTSGIIRRLLEIIDNGSSYEAIREAVQAEYASRVPPQELAGIIQKMMILAELAGSASVRQDQPLGETL
jgi:phage gp29-like protein